MFIKIEVSAVDNESADFSFVSFREKSIHIGGSALNYNLKSSLSSLLINDIGEGEVLLGNLNDTRIDLTDCQLLDTRVVLEDLGGNDQVASSNDDHMIVILVWLHDSINHCSCVVVFELESLACDLDCSVKDKDTSEAVRIVHPDVLELGLLSVNKSHVLVNFTLWDKVIC